MNIKEFLNHQVKNYKSTLHPFYLYYTILWIASKAYQRIFNREHTVWETFWKAFLKFFGDDPYNIYVNGSFVFAITLFIIFISFYSILDFTLSPKTLRKYKVQEGTNEPPDTKKFIKAIILVSFNIIFVGFPLGYLLYKIVEHRGIPDLHVLPPFDIFITQCFLCIVFYEITFYASHRMMHTKFFYKRIHKIHHEWTSSVSLVAIYCHPLEFALGNVQPLAAGILIMNCHIAVHWAWLFILICSTTGDHSGYHLPFIHSAEFHDVHHLRFNVNYGVYGWMDRLFGTDASFKGTINDVRHRTLFTLESARERFPDGCEKVKEM